MQAVVQAARSLFCLPYELLDAVLQRVRPRDVDSFARICHKSFEHSPRFIEGHLRTHSHTGRPAPQSPQSPPELPWLRQPAAVRPQHMRTNSVKLAVEEARKRSICVLHATDLLGDTPVKLQPLATGEFTTADLGIKTHDLGWPGPHLYVAARRDPQTHAATTLVFMLPPQLGYDALATAVFSFPSDDVMPNDRRSFSLYSVGENLVGLCTAGGQTRVFLVVPQRYALHLLQDNVLTPHPLADIPLTALKMAPITWAHKARAVMVWADGVPELWAVASPV